MSIETNTTNFAARMPELHAGTPNGMTLTIELHVVRETERAVLVELPGDGDAPGQAWLPKSKVTVFDFVGPSFRRVYPGVAQVHHWAKKISLPVWLYNEKRPQLLGEKGGQPA